MIAVRNQAKTVTAATGTGDHPRWVFLISSDEELYSRSHFDSSSVCNLWKGR